MINQYMILLLSFAIFSCGSIGSNQRKKDKDMKNTTFIPKEFNDIKLGYYETNENACSPKFSNGITPLNTITVSTPQKITCDISIGSTILIIPICVVYNITQRRGLKYNDLSAKILHIKKNGEEKIYSGEIVDKNMRYEHPIYPPDYEEQEKERLLRVKEAQKYKNDELNEGNGSGGYMNLNLLEYIDISLQAGKYEIYLSFSGLESNHVEVEIIFQK